MENNFILEYELPPLDRYTLRNVHKPDKILETIEGTLEEAFEVLASYVKEDNR